MQVSLVLAAVQVTPGSLLGVVVVERQSPQPLKTGLRLVFRVLSPHLHALPSDGQIHAAHGAGGRPRTAPIVRSEWPCASPRLRVSRSASLKCA